MSSIHRHSAAMFYRYNKSTLNTYTTRYLIHPTFKSGLTGILKCYIYLCGKYMLHHTQTKHLLETFQQMKKTIKNPQHYSYLEQPSRNTVLHSQILITRSTSTVGVIQHSVVQNSFK